MTNKFIVYALFCISSTVYTMEETQSITNKNSILRAAFEGNLEKVNEFIKQKRNVNVKDDIHCTPLMYASEHGHKAIVIALIKAGAQVNDYNKNWNTPLMYAAMGSHMDIIDELMKAGAIEKMNSANLDGYTALGVAKRWGSKKTEELLRAYGARESRWCVIS